MRQALAHLKNFHMTKAVHTYRTEKMAPTTRKKIGVATCRKGKIT